MPHKGRRAPRTLHRELSLDCLPTLHAPLFTRARVWCTFMGVFNIIDTGWSDEAVPDINAGAYRWTGAFTYLGVDWEWGFSQRASGTHPGMDYAWTLRPFLLGEANWDAIGLWSASWQTTAPWDTGTMTGLWTHENNFGPGFGPNAIDSVQMFTKPYF